jgi:hypothetical protein
VSWKKGSNARASTSGGMRRAGTSPIDRAERTGQDRSSASPVFATFARRES